MLPEIVASLLIIGMCVLALIALPPLIRLTNGSQVARERPTGEQPIVLDPTIIATHEAILRARGASRPELKAYDQRIQKTWEFQDKYLSQTPEEKDAAREAFHRYIKQIGNESWRI